MGTLLSFQRDTTLPPIMFGPCLLWPSAWMDQDATWYRARTRPRGYCVTWAPTSHRKGHSSLPLFGPCLLQPNGRPSQILMSTCLSCSELFDESRQFQPNIEPIIWRLRCGSSRLSFAKILGKYSSWLSRDVVCVILRSAF